MCPKRSGNSGNESQYTPPRTYSQVNVNQSSKIGANIRVIQRGCGSGFAPEALQDLGITRVLWQELERNRASQPSVFGFVDNTPVNAGPERKSPSHEFSDHNQYRKLFLRHPEDFLAGLISQNRTSSLRRREFSLVTISGLLVRVLRKAVRIESNSPVESGKSMSGDVYSWPTPAARAPMAMQNYGRAS